MKSKILKYLREREAKHQTELDHISNEYLKAKSTDDKPYAKYNYQLMEKYGSLLHEVKSTIKFVEGLNVTVPMLPNAYPMYEHNGVITIVDVSGFSLVEKVTTALDEMGYVRDDKESEDIPCVVHIYKPKSEDSVGG